VIIFLPDIVQASETVWNFQVTARMQGVEIASAQGKITTSEELRTGEGDMDPGPYEMEIILKDASIVIPLIYGDYEMSWLTAELEDGRGCIECWDSLRLKISKSELGKLFKLLVGGIEKFPPGSIESLEAWSEDQFPISLYASEGYDAMNGGEFDRSAPRISIGEKGGFELMFDFDSLRAESF